MGVIDKDNYHISIANLRGSIIVTPLTKDKKSVRHVWENDKVKLTVKLVEMKSWTAKAAFKTKDKTYENYLQCVKEALTELQASLSSNRQSLNFNSEIILVNCNIVFEKIVYTLVKEKVRKSYGSISEITPIIFSRDSVGFTVEDSIVSIVSASKYKTNVTIQKVNNQKQLVKIVNVINKLLEQKAKKGLFDFTSEEPRQSPAKSVSNSSRSSESSHTPKPKPLNSTSCQKHRQPVEITDGTTLKGSHLLKFDGKNYDCQNPKFTFPGFTIKDTPCCFKKDQRSKPKYIKNTARNTARVRPTNVKVEGENVIFSEGKYYVLKDHNLQQISDPQIVRKLVGRGESILLPEIPFDILFSSKGCAHPKVGGVCPPGFPHFGYTENSVPCCFSEPRPEEVVHKPHTRKETGYTIQTDKPLLEGQRGKLTDILSEIFGNSFFRYGADQDKLEFLNVVYILTGIPDLKNKVLNHLEKFWFLDPKGIFKDYLLNKGSKISFELQLRGISSYIKKNIIVLDLNGTPQSKILFNFPETIFILKNGNRFEGIGSNKKKIFTDIPRQIHLQVGSTESALKVYILLKDNLIGQVINCFGNTVYLTNFNGKAIPVYPSTPIYNLKEVVLTPDTIEKSLKYLGKLPQDLTFDVEGLIERNRVIVAIQFKNGLSLPVKPVAGKGNTEALYLPKIDEYICKGKGSNDKRSKYVDHKQQKDNLYKSYRLELSQIFKSKIELQKLVVEVVTSVSFTRETKLNRVNNIVKHMIPGIDTENLWLLTNDILFDTHDREIVKGLV